MQEESQGDRLTKDTKVGDALEYAGSDAVLVNLDTPIMEIAARAAAHPSVRVLCVVDSEGRLQGLIRVNALCDDLFFHVFPEDFISDILEAGKLDEFRRFTSARLAADLMEAVDYVRPADSLGLAFKRLHDKSLDGIPVVDDSGRLVAYLDRLRLISIWLDSHRADQPI